MTNKIIEHSVPVTLSDSNFRAWGAAVNNLFSTAGLIQTADTGQINWSTVVRAAPYGIAGYEIWRFNDALQATTPIFFKISYGTGQNTQTLSAKIAVGSGSDGSGNLTGLGAALEYWWIFGATNQDTPNSKILTIISGDGSGFVIVNAINGATTGHKGTAIIDRIRNSDGTPSSRGLCYRMHNHDWVAPTIITYDRVAGQVYTTSGGGALMPVTPLSGTSSVQPDGSAPIAPIFSLVPDFGLIKLKMGLVYNSPDFGLWGNINVSHLGATRKYKTLGSYIGKQDSYGYTEASLAIWWED